MDVDQRISHPVQRLLEFVQGMCSLGLVLLLPTGICYWAFHGPSAHDRLPESSSNCTDDGRSAHLSPVRAMGVSSDGQYLNVVHSNLLWSRRDAHTGRELGRRRIAEQPLNHIAIHNQDGKSIGVNHRAQFEVWGETDALWRGELPGQQPKEDVTWCSLSQERNLAAAVSNKGSLWLLEFDGLQVNLHSHAAIGQALGYVEFSPAEDRVALVTADQTILIWDVSQARVLARPDTEVPCRFVSWSGDGNRLMSYGCDREVLVWQAETGELVRRWSVDSQVASAAKLSWNGRLAAVSEGNLIRVWDVETGREHSVLNGHAGVISVLHFADEDRTLFSGDINGKLCRWSLTDQREVWSVP